MTQIKTTYRACLGDQKFDRITFYKWFLFLRQSNSRPVDCGKCQGHYGPGECVKHTLYRSTYYICLPCAKCLIHQYGQRGYRVNILESLQMCEYSHPIFTAEEVSASIQRFILRRDPNGVEILMPIQTQLSTVGKSYAQP